MRNEILEEFDNDGDKKDDNWLWKKNENKNLALNTGKFFLGCLIGFDGRNK